MRSQTWALIALVLVGTCVVLALSASSDEAAAPLDPDRGGVQPEDAEPSLRSHGAAGGQDWDEGIQPRPHAPRSVQIVVTVLGESGGEPIEGAMLCAWPAGTRALIYRFGPHRTADDGFVRLTVPAAVFPVVLTVVAEGYGGKRTTLLEAAAATGRLETVVRLARGHGLEGAVVDQDGKPVAGARVICRELDRPFHWPMSETWIQTQGLPRGNAGFTDATGRFAARGLAWGTRYRVHVWKEGFTSRRAVRDQVIATPGDEVEVTLYQASSLILQVLDSQTGELLPTAQALVASPAGQTSYGIRAGLDPDPAGAHLKGGELRLRYRAAGPVASAATEMRGTVYALGYKPWKGTLRLKFGGVSRVQIRLERIAQGPRVPVRFVIRPREAGRDFSGTLQLGLARTDSGVGPQARALVDVAFENGRAKRVVPLFPGAYYVGADGVGAAGAWWHPAIAREHFKKHVVEALVHGAAELELPLRLSGGMARVVVKDSSGRVRRGFDLQVIYSDNRGNEARLRGWDTPSLPPHPTSVDGSADSQPHVWLRPVAGMMRAVLPGVGAGEAPFRALRFGEVADLGIVLSG